MRSILVLLEDLVQAEFGPRDLDTVRGTAERRLQDTGRMAGAPGRVMSFIEAIADVRRRPIADAYQVVAMKLVPRVMQEYGALLTGHTSARTVLMQITRLAPTVLDALIPGIPSADFDVELLDLETLRVRFEGPEEMLAAFEGIAVGLAAHYGERAETTRVNPPAFAPTRRMLDIRIGPERRQTPPRSRPPVPDPRRRLRI